MQTENNNKTLKNKGNALILSFIGIALSLTLLCFDFISELTFFALVVISVLVGKFIHNPGSVKSFNLLKGELILKDIKETETSVKELAKAILDVTEKSSFGMMTEGFDSEAKDKAVEKLRKLTI